MTAAHAAQFDDFRWVTSRPFMAAVAVESSADEQAALAQCGSCRGGTDNPIL